MSRTAASSPALKEELENCLRSDRIRLRRHMSRSEDPVRIQAQIAAARERRERRERLRPVPRFEDDLPINLHRDEIQAALAVHQVIVVCGATGSGKSTQLPKMCLEMGRGADGYIGHTQPRRIAARSIATRLAQELNTELGGVIGYKVRFFERFNKDGFIKVLTDGMLLAELERDRHLDQYDTLILDEAHERSLNIDFLLGYLKRLLPGRPDLKLIITSATIDPQSFAEHFNAAPVIEVSGRSYPVEIRYRPFDDSDQRQDRNMFAAAVKAVEEVEGEGPGDILVFLSGERDIHELTRILRKRPVKHTEIVPLYARLPNSEQQRVFAPHSGRRIVLATNVAETSLTVPGVRYVIDSGLARISRYSPGRQVQRLPIEAIAQSSATQRSGRCGRTGPGICIRLYSEEAFIDRREFTEPEILRTSLASVILRMQSQRLGAVERFPFITPPTDRMINDGYRLLDELAAVNSRRRLTALGKKLARLPVDPRIGRIIIAAADLDCLSEILTIAAALEVADPRDYPPQQLERSRSVHAQYVNKDSDFLSLLLLWERYHRDTHAIGQRRTRKYCQDNFLSYPRMREWIDVRNQLSELARELHLKINTKTANNETIHKALLSGLIGNIAMADERHHYLGTRGKHVYLHPGSNLFKRKPKWIMAAELVDTGKLYARMCASIKPEWVEPYANQLVSKTYLEPHWEKTRGQVVAYEQVSLYGLLLIPRRKINFGAIDPKLAREIFIRGALISGEISPLPDVIEQNQRLIKQLEKLEHKSRRRDVVIDEATLYQCYAERLPETMHDARTFHGWLQINADTLRLQEKDLMQHDAAQVTMDRFPDHLQIHANKLPLKYNFHPGHPNDGVTVLVPLPLLQQLRPGPFTWLVPGLLLEKIIALIRSLPKSLRRNFVPAPDVAEKVLPKLTSQHGDLKSELAQLLSAQSNLKVSPGSFDDSKLAPHLFMNFALVDIDNQQNISDSDRNLTALQQRHAGISRTTAAQTRPAHLERDDMHTWDLETFPDQVQWQRGEITMRGYPALVDRKDHVALRIFDDINAAHAAMRNGVLRLVLLQLPQQAKQLRKGLPDMEHLALAWSNRIPRDALLQDIINAAGLEVIGDARTIRDKHAFDDCVERARRELVPTATDLVQTLRKVIPDYLAVSKHAGNLPANVQKEIAARIAELIYPGFVSTTPLNWLRQYPRYFKALATRLKRLTENPAKDAIKADQVLPLQTRYDRTVSELDGPPPQKLIEYRFLLQEFRVSLFAQPMQTVVPASPKRLDNLWAQVQSELKR